MLEIHQSGREPLICKYRTATSLQGLLVYLLQGGYKCTYCLHGLATYASIMDRQLLLATYTSIMDRQLLLATYALIMDRQLLLTTYALIMDRQLLHLCIQFSLSHCLLSCSVAPCIHVYTGYTMSEHMVLSFY